MVLLFLPAQHSHFVVAHCLRMSSTFFFYTQTVLAAVGSVGSWLPLVRLSCSHCHSHSDHRLFTLGSPAWRRFATIATNCVKAHSAGVTGQRPSAVALKTMRGCAGAITVGCITKSS
jgi:hypothetical protein